MNLEFNKIFLPTPSKSWLRQRYECCNIKIKWIQKIMKWIDSKNLRDWANRRNCQETLPLLVRKLIRATSKTIKSIKFPSGESVLLGGWDGILEVREETEYLPEGISLWEFGTSKDPKGKADDDYEKRTANPLGYNPADSTFIFVTPRLWQNGKDWVEEKMKDGKWKDIRVINSEILGAALI